MNNLNDIRILVREIISEKFEGGIEGGMFQSASDKSARSSSSSNYEGKEKDSLYPFSGSITDRPTYDAQRRHVQGYPGIIGLCKNLACWWTLSWRCVRKSNQDWTTDLFSYSTTTLSNCNEWMAPRVWKPQKN